MSFSHEQQQLIWEREHKKPCLLSHLAGRNVSGGVEAFWNYFSKHKFNNLKTFSGLEICCGKGRNAIWLAKQGVRMEAFDFSPSAIKTAQLRVTKSTVDLLHFFEHDATCFWPFSQNQFDFVIDCFASTDIDGAKNRQFVCKELYRVLKPGGYFFLYTNSTNSDLYKIKKSLNRGEEPNSYFYSKTGKFEKVFDKEELDDLYCAFKLIKSKVYKRKSVVMGYSYYWEHFWRVYQKPF